MSLENRMEERSLEKSPLLEKARERLQEVDNTALDEPINGKLRPVEETGEKWKKEGGIVVHREGESPIPFGSLSPEQRYEMAEKAAAKEKEAAHQMKMSQLSEGKPSETFHAKWAADAAKEAADLRRRAK